MKNVYIFSVISIILLFLFLTFMSCILNPQKDPDFSLEALSEISSEATLNSGVGLELRLTNKDDKSNTFSVIVTSSLGFNAKSNLKETFTLKKKTYADFWVNFDIPNNESLIEKTEETQVWAEHADGKKSKVITFYTEIVPDPNAIKLVQNVVSVGVESGEQFWSNGWRPGKWQGNTFSGSWDFQQFGSHFTGSILAEYDPATKTLTKFVWNQTKKGIRSLSYELRNMTLDQYYDFGTYFLVFKETGQQCANHVVNYQRITYHADGSSSTDNSAELDHGSEIVISFSKD